MPHALPRLLPLALALAVALTLCGIGDASVTLRNDSSRSLDSVVVEVTGNQYPIGTLPPGESMTLRVQPTGESSVMVSHSRASDLDLNVYIEPGLGADIRAVLGDTTVQDVTYEW